MEFRAILGQVFLGLVSLDILSSFGFILIGFKISFSILLIAFSNNFLYSIRNKKIFTRLNFSSSILLVNSFTNYLTLLASSL
jgi:hypothetical protein